MFVEHEFVHGEGVATTFVWSAFIGWLIILILLVLLEKRHQKLSLSTKRITETFIAELHEEEQQEQEEEQEEEQKHQEEEEQHVERELHLAANMIQHHHDTRRRCAEEQITSTSDICISANEDNASHSLSESHHFSSILPSPSSLIPQCDSCVEVNVLPHNVNSFDFLHKRAKFVTFQRNFLIVWGCCMFADWLKGPYTVALYASYGFSLYQIAVLFIAGFMASLLIGTWIGALADPLGRARVCRWYCVLFVLSMASKLCKSFTVLIVGRVLGGVATSLLATTFESWMLSEHQRNAFLQPWVQETFASMAIINGVSAVMAGLTAELAVAMCGNVGPFIVAIPVTLFPLWLAQYWHENYGENKHHWLTSVCAAYSVIKQTKRLWLLGMCEAFFESAMFIWVYAWALVLDRTNRQSPFGIIFATFMLCTICGSLIARMLSVSVTINIVHCLALVSMIVTVCCFTHKHASCVAFMVYEIAIGMYFASHPVLRSSWINDAHRAGVLNLFRVPINLIVIGVLELHLSPYHIMCVLVLAQLLSLLCLCALHAYIT